MGDIECRTHRRIRGCDDWHQMVPVAFVDLGEVMSRVECLEVRTSCDIPLGSTREPAEDPPQLASIRLAVAKASAV